MFTVKKQKLFNDMLVEKTQMLGWIGRKQKIHYKQNLKFNKVSEYI